MFDRPEWWQLLALLAPLAAVVHGLRWREARLANTPYSQLSQTQRGYILLHNLPPGTAAAFWNELEPWERESYLNSGKQIRGSGKQLVAPLVKEVLKALTQDKSKPPSTESNDPLDKLTLAAEFCRPQLLLLLRQRFPALKETPSEQ